MSYCVVATFTYAEGLRVSKGVVGDPLGGALSGFTLGGDQVALGVLRPVCPPGYSVARVPLSASDGRVCGVYKKDTVDYTIPDVYGAIIAFQTTTTLQQLCHKVSGVQAVSETRGTFGARFMGLQRCVARLSSDRDLATLSWPQSPGERAIRRGG